MKSQAGARASGRLRALTERVRDPGFTPSVRDADALVDLLGDDESNKAAERAIARLGAAAVDTLGARLALARPPLRGRIVRAIGRLGKDPGAQTLLISALNDPDDKTRRNAAIGLGHGREDAVEGALLEAWARDPRPEMRRSIAASLGKVGGALSLPLLREATRGTDAELRRIAERACLMIERTASRGDARDLDGDRAPSSSVHVVATARSGLEDLLAEELSVAAGVDDVRVAGPGRVRARLSGPMNALWVARTMISFSFPIATEWTTDADDEADAIARAVSSPMARAVLHTWTEGAPRYRIAWTSGGHRRAATWSAIRAIGARAPELVNDPTASGWELVVSTQRRFVEVSLSPRALRDPRFAWRRKDVPAASHPTIAAALARVARAYPDDVVWDPFVGSGAELIERARLGAYRALIGSDLDARALSAARENLDAAGLGASLVQADALSYAPDDVTLVITNPPMGRRASRAAGLGETLDAFLAHAASRLAPGGRLVWMAPWPARARAAATRAGLTLDGARTVDMGGFDAEMQAWTKPGGSSARATAGRVSPESR